ncbi:MAG: glycoside hydrolase family 97 protein [Paludibacteraceae bacterium]|nr:glycoside hydrolase family 97 protein [Paludibacteraceae bacterium]
MRKLLTFILITVTFFSYSQKQYTLVSPDGKLKTEITVGKTTEYAVSHNGDLMLEKSPVSMKLSDGRIPGTNAKVKKTNKKSVNESIDAEIYKKAKVENNYNELSILFSGDYSLVFRVYNDGMAYRFETNFKKPFTVENEQAVFNFPGNPKAFLAYVNKADNSTFSQQFYNSFENTYNHIDLKNANPQKLAFLPLVVEGKNGKKICITEADLLNYPGMYLYNPDGGNSLTAMFAPYPKEIRQGGHNMLQGEVQSAENFIARCEGKTTFPWRTVIIAENDYELTDNDMVYKLATTNQLTDISWIKPGKVAWDWWNDWNIRNVDFESGVNDETYKYYIDFAATHGIEYVILDEGWAVNKQADLFQVIPEINLKELVEYGKSKNVNLILWAGYWAFNRDIEGICKHYAEMGIKGFKVDFMDRDDQQMVDFYHRAAQIAAKYKLMLDFHGAYKPTGLQRTYPNVINFEGVHGLEQMKWSPASVDQVAYDVTIPFIRMVAGPMDYTQGAMRNATRSNYRPVNSEPMSQGTRVRQLAQYVIFEAPFNMLCDNPSNYMAEPECTQFIAEIPTVWDETVALNGEISKYVTIARRTGNQWYLGSMTNWDARTLEVDLSFLGTGNYKAEIFCDGVNAHRTAMDYRKDTVDVPANRKMTLKMAPGGGFVMKIMKK